MTSYLSLAKWVIDGTLTLKPGLPAGSFQEWFQVKTNYPSLANVNFLANGQIIGNVSISGSGFNRETGIVNLGSTATGVKIARDLLIQFSGSSAQSASVQVKAEPAWIRTELSPPKDVGQFRFFTLTIEIPQDAPTGSYVFDGDGQQALVTLKTGDDSVPVVRIPLDFAVVRQ